MLRICVASLLASFFSSAFADYPEQTPTFLPGPDLRGCTAILVDPHGSIDGGMTTHTNDCHQCDPRIAKVPARDWPKGSLRPVFKYRSQYPRYLGDDFGDDYKVENTDLTAFPWQPTVPIGHIPQVDHTYAYVDGNYGIINEFQVAMGESTCAGRIVSVPVCDGGKALLDIAMLSKLGMERATTAREAVIIMGDLAVKYGYYGAEWKGPMAEGEAGEALTITDPNESYVFHILPDSTGTSAIWAAQKLEKGHIAVVANAFIIKEIDFNNKDTFLYSDNIVSEAEKLGFYDSSFGPFHFTKTYGLVTTFDKYSFRRAWRVLSTAAPSRNFPGNSTIASLPFSVKAERLWNKTDLMWLQRDHFEGTPYDATQGPASGPYGNPTRYDQSPYFNISYNILFQGQFERTISIHRTIYSFVTLSRSFVPNSLGLVWFGSAIPHSTYYQPVYVHASSVPGPLRVGGLHGFDRRSTFWAATVVEGWLEKCYRLTIVDVAAAQRDLEKSQAEDVKNLEKQAFALLAAPQESEQEKQAALVSLLTDFEKSNGDRALQTWWSLFEFIIVKFHDGFRVDNVHVDAIAPMPVFYPLWWLKGADYFPNNQIDYTKTTWSYAVHPPTLPPKPQAQATHSLINLNENLSSEMVNNSYAWSGLSVFMAVIITGILCLAVGVYIGMKMASGSKSGYVAINDNDFSA